MPISYPWLPLQQALASRRYDVVIIEFWYMAESCLPLITKSQPWAKVIVDSVDLHCLRRRRGVALGLEDPNDVEADCLRELAIYRQADRVLVVTDEERRALREEGVRTPLHWIPNVVSARPRPAAPAGSQLLFIGGMNHDPNSDGIIWFVREIFPKIRGAVPDAEVLIVGGGAKPEVEDLQSQPGVRVLGHVLDTEPLLSQAAVSIAPLRYGAGMKGKVCEAMAYGLPVVSTRIGIEGLPIIDGVSAEIADDAAGFAEAVVRLLKNPERAHRVGLAGQQAVAEVISPEAVEPALLEAVRAAAETVRLPSRRQSLRRNLWRIKLAAATAIHRAASATGLLPAIKSASGRPAAARPVPQATPFVRGEPSK